MPTGYEVQMYNDIHQIARALHNIEKHLAALVNPSEEN